MTLLPGLQRTLGGLYCIFFLTVMGTQMNALPKKKKKRCSVSSSSVVGAFAPRKEMKVSSLSLKLSKDFAHKKFLISDLDVVIK